MGRNQADRPTPTKEMIEAGLAAYYRSDRRFDSDEEIVSGIYAAMAALSGPAMPQLK